LNFGMGATPVRFLNASYSANMCNCDDTPAPPEAASSRFRIDVYPDPRMNQCSICSKPILASLFENLPPFSLRKGTAGASLVQHYCHSRTAWLPCAEPPFKVHCAPQYKGRERKKEMKNANET
jgi:hypothetical protein